METKSQSGIYQIKCLVSDQFYIGSAKDLNKRKIDHWRKLKHKNHPNQYLQNIWNKHKECSMVFEHIEYCDISSLIAKEQEYIDRFYDNQDKCVNLCPTAGSCLGRKHTDETKKKMSKAHKGKIVSEETRKNMSAAQKLNTKGHLKPGKDNPMYGRIGNKHHGSKFIIQVSIKNFEILKTYSCVKEAAEENNTQQPNISRAAKYKRTAGGFYWLFEDNKALFEMDKANYFTKKKRTISAENKRKLIEARKRVSFKGFVGEHTEETKRKISLTKMPKDKKKIVELDGYNKVVETFKCSYDVVRKYKLDNKSLSRVLNGTRATIYGRRFEYR